MDSENDEKIFGYDIFMLLIGLVFILYAAFLTELKLAPVELQDLRINRAQYYFSFAMLYQMICVT